MNRCLAFLGALLLAFLSVSSACMAAPSEWVGFTLRADRHGSNVQADFNDRGHDNNWSSGFKPSELIGFDVNGFYTAGTRPIRFAIVREAGRLDCAGNGGAAYASGNCNFTADPNFTQLLLSRGIGRPNPHQAMGLMSLDVRRDLIETLATAQFPRPTIDDLMALTALGVDRGYINALSRAGYRPQTIQSLTEFKALNIGPDWIGGLVRIGYANVPSSDLVQLKALDVDANFISGFDRLGYRHLPVDQLVQLKALGITPEFARSVVGDGGSPPPVDDLVQMRLFGRRY